MKTDVEQSASAAIVLGGGMQKTTNNKGETIYEPKGQVKARLDEAYKLFKNGEVDYIVNTGGFHKVVALDKNVSGPKTEAEVSNKYLFDHYDVDPAKVLYENQSFDTTGNAFFAKKICLKPRNITNCKIITSDFHMERALMLCKWVLGPAYTIEAISLPSDLDAEARTQRGILEQVFIDYTKEYLLGSIAAGDDEAIEQFMKTEHLNYCLSERSEAMLQAHIEVAAYIRAGY